MKRHRYLIIDHPEQHAVLGFSNGFVTGGLPIHGLLSNYHWARLDEQCVIVAASYNLAHHIMLQNHPAVTVLPILSSGKNVLAHAQQKPAHAKAMAAHGVAPSHTMADFVELIEAKFGPIFSAEK